MAEERWVLRYRPTRFSYLLNYFLALAFSIILLSLVPFLDMHFLSSRLMFLSLLGAIAFLIIEPEIALSNREYVLTLEGIISTEGILSKRRVEIPYAEVKNLKIEQNLLGKFLEYGNVLIEGDKGRIKMVGINNPEEAYKVIEYKVDELKLAVKKKETEEAIEPSKEESKK